jgi:hypothetical protein
MCIQLALCIVDLTTVDLTNYGLNILKKGKTDFFLFIVPQTAHSNNYLHSVYIVGTVSHPQMI